MPINHFDRLPDTTLPDEAGERRPDDGQAAQALLSVSSALRTQQHGSHDHPPPGRRPQAEAASD